MLFRSLEPSQRERECLELVGRLTSGGPVAAREAARLLPERGQFVALWRAIERQEREECSPAGRLPLLRRFACATGGAECFLRAALGVEVFAERGLVTLAVQDDMMIIHPRPGRRADLEQSAYVRSLRRLLGHGERGGR